MTDADNIHAYKERTNSGVIKLKNVISEKLSLLNQAHILKHIKELDESEQEKLINQIENLDFSVLDELGAEEKRGHIEPLYAMTLKEIEENKKRYTDIGIQARLFVRLHLAEIMII